MIINYLRVKSCIFIGIMCLPHPFCWNLGDCWGNLCSEVVFWFVLERSEVINSKGHLRSIPGETIQGGCRDIGKVLRCHAPCPVLGHDVWPWNSGAALEDGRGTDRIEQGGQGITCSEWCVPAGQNHALLKSSQFFSPRSFWAAARNASAPHRDVTPSGAISQRKSYYTMVERRGGPGGQAPSPPIKGDSQFVETSGFQQSLIFIKLRWFFCRTMNAS